MTKWECKECLEGIETEVKPCVYSIGRKVDVGENWDGPATCPISGTDCNWEEMSKPFSRLWFKELICRLIGHKWYQIDNNGNFVNDFICLRCAEGKPKDG